MILRAVVALLTSLSLVLTPLAYASALPATAAMQVSPDAADDDAWLSPGDVVDAGLTGGERYFAHEYDKNFLDLLKSNDPDDFDDIRRQAVKNGLDRDRLGLLNKVSDVAELGEFAMHLKQEEWTKAGEMALSTLLDRGSDALLAVRYGVLAAQVCGFFMVAAPACVVGLLVVGSLAKSKLAEVAAERTIAWGKAQYCARWPETSGCPRRRDSGQAYAGGSPVPSAGSGLDAGALPGPSARSGAPVRPGGVAAARPGGERVSVSGGSIDVKAGAVVTSAAGGATAETDIGVREGGGGRLSVSVGNVVTTATGTDARTVIGAGSGSVSAQDIYNQGGTLVMGDSVTRDGKTCIEFYLRTCIVHVYYRRKSDPCAPGYWMQYRKCMLPADTRHSVGRH